MRHEILSRLMAGALLLTGCAANSDALASASPVAAGTPRLPGSGTVRWTGGASIELADLKLEALTARPEAMLKIRIERALASTERHAHDAGFVYALAGSQRVIFADRAVDVSAGRATLIAPPSFMHRHDIAPGATWLFVSAGDAERTESSGGHGPVVFESAALAPLATGTHPGGVYTLGYTETLRRLELDPAAQGPVHSTSGYEMIYVLEGALELRLQGRASALAAGAAQVIASRQAIQIVNNGSAPATALMFFVTPGGEPYEVDSPP